MRGAIIATVALQLAWPISAAAQGRYVKVPVRAAITDFRLFQRNRTTDLAASTDSVRLLPGEFVVSRFADSVLTRSDSSGSITWELPIQLTGIDGDGDLVDLQAAVIVEAGGLRRRPDGLFAGSILLGIQNARDPSRRHPLGRSIAVLVTANADSVRPEQVGIDHTNLPFQRVQLVAIAPPDTVAVRVRPEFDLRGVDINLPVVRPSLMLAASPQRIQGFGLESAALTVRAVGVTGAEGMVVSLTSDRSAPEPGEVPLSAAGTGSSEIRSSGLGRATVTAASPPLVAGQVVVSFGFPWAFLISAVLGGLAGALAREGWFRFRRQEAVSPGKLVANVVTGILIGCITAVLYAVGINVFDVEPAAKRGEAIVFGISALGAIGGLTVLKKLVPHATEQPSGG